MIRLPRLNGDCCICIDALNPDTENYRCIRSECESGRACVECWDKVQDQTACPVCRVKESDMVTNDPLVLDALFAQDRKKVIERSIQKHPNDAKWFRQVMEKAHPFVAEMCARLVLLEWWEYSVPVLEIIPLFESKCRLRRYLTGSVLQFSHRRMKKVICRQEAMRWMVNLIADYGSFHPRLMDPQDREDVDTWVHCTHMCHNKERFELYFQLATGNAKFPRERERDLFLAVFRDHWQNTQDWAFDWLCPLALNDPELLDCVRPLRKGLSKQSNSAGLLQLVLAEDRTLVFSTEFSDRRLEESAARYPLRYRLDRRGLFAFFRGDSDWTRIGQDLLSNNYESMFAFNDRTRNVLYWSDDEEVDTNDEQKFTVVDLNGQALFRVELIREGANLEIFTNSGYYRSVVPVPGKVYKFTNFTALGVFGEDKAKRVLKRKYYRLE